MLLLALLMETHDDTNSAGSAIRSGLVFDVSARFFTCCLNAPLLIASVVGVALP